ncbi:site-2 protease family protein [Micrococcus luteus]|uniref:M50 family metallopeptidase n=1 Tax=Micrococcus luteus TaxID=1270 RepID=UPI0001C50190|nr:site-2 protease family protein [Micrococcus luteus]EFD51374.1 peptidase, M50 family [Micrococcus luteus SK58]MCV7511057.1 site-2 protease family protein [Micrococcus luteus]MCV7520156.1 site-2 protease family protein [Micrococcus luteus]MCV7570923.1 site-2 protease family protein [Micrococcus luteus]MCV7624448.1 site-2 protease family protein [Micrococcus luteus]
MSGPASVRLGTIAGAPVRLSWSWLLIAAVITLAFGPQIQRALPSLGGGAYAVALGYAVLLALSVLAHEAAHALTGCAFGQRTEEIALTLWGGHTQFRSPSARPLDTVLTAMAGPTANLVLAGLAHLAARAVAGPSVPALLLEVTVWANLLLAAFNALPGTPLDGGRMVESAVWAATGSRARGVEAAGWAGRVVAVGVLAAVLGPPILAGRAPDLFVVVLAAWVALTLWRGADDAVRHGRWSRRLETLRLEQVETPAVALPEHLGVAEALAQADDGRRAVVAVDGAGRPRGVLDLTAAVALTPARRTTTPLAAVAVALAPEAVLVRDDVPASGPDLAARLADPQTPVWVLTDAHGLVRSVVPRETILAAVDATRRP